MFAPHINILSPSRVVGEWYDPAQELGGWFGIGVSSVCHLLYEIDIFLYKGSTHPKGRGDLINIHMF